MENSIAITAAAATHRGIVRGDNEDNLYFNGCVLAPDGEEDFYSFDMEKTEKGCVFAVCDGMGGLNNGKRAAQICANAFEDVQSKLNDGDTASAKDALLDAINSANINICDEMKENGLQMGSTVAALAICQNRAVIANVGDSRVYRVCKKRLEQLSVDHNEAEYLVENGVLSEGQARRHPSRNRLTQHVGISPDELVIYPSTDSFNLDPKGETFLICSDGLYSMVEDARVAEIINSADSLSAAAKALAEKAVGAGGKDNITVILVRAAAAEEQTSGERQTSQAEVKNKAAIMQTIKLYIRKLFDIRKKGEAPYAVTPRLLLARFLFACAFFSVLMGIMSYILRNVVGI